MSLKRNFWRLLGKDPEAVIVSFPIGPEPQARAMMTEVLSLLPDREHFAVTHLEIEGVTSIGADDLRILIQRKRIGLAPTLLPGGFPLAFRYAPRKILGTTRGWNDTIYGRPLQSRPHFSLGACR
jgi:hypothetical protein